jgi:hypothetical protein
METSKERHASGAEARSFSWVFGTAEAAPCYEARVLWVFPLPVSSCPFETHSFSASEEARALHGRILPAEL